MKSNIINKNDSENQIIQKRSLEEINIWLSHLDYLSEEGDFLVNITKHKLKNKELKESLLKEIEKNNSIQNTLLTYKNSTDNLKECIDLDCDLYYYNEHEKVRNLYLEYINNFRKLKKKVFNGLLTAK